MIEAVQNLIDDLEKFEKLFEEVFIEAVRLNEKEIIKLNTDEQLFKKGVDSNGNKLSPPYRPKTVRIKRKKGQPFNRVTTRDTGDFHESFFLDMKKGEFEIMAGDNKTRALLRKYGKEVLGLTDDSLQRAIEIIEEDFFNGFKNIVLG